MTCHARDFMNRIVFRIIEVGNRTVTTYSGNYDFYLREREIRREQLLASYRRQQEMLAKEEEFIARFAARPSHSAQVQSRAKKIEKIERIELPPEQKIIRFEFAESPRSGDDVMTMDSLAKTWTLPDGNSKSVFGGITGLIRRQEKIAVVGVNGAGKSTFLKVLAGPDRTHRWQPQGRGKRQHRRSAQSVRSLPLPGRRGGQTHRQSVRRRNKPGGAGHPAGPAVEPAHPR
jgi:ATP-binding cassette subfamily F protein 3